MFLRASKHFYASSLSAFVACESKSDITIFPTSLMNKLLFRYISCSFLIMVLITTVSLSLSSNKLGNNFNYDTSLLMPMLLLLIFFKISTILQLIGCFLCRQESKMRISDAFFEQKRFSFNNLTHVVF